MTRRRRAVRPVSVCNDLYSAHTHPKPACLHTSRKKKKKKRKEHKISERRQLKNSSEAKGPKKKKRLGVGWLGDVRNRMAGLIAGCRCSRPLSTG